MVSDNGFFLAVFFARLQAQSFVVGHVFWERQIRALAPRWGQKFFPIPVNQCLRWLLRFRPSHLLEIILNRYDNPLINREFSYSSSMFSGGRLTGLARDMLE